MERKNPHADTVRRAALPEILFPPDLALALGIPEPEADQAARSGALGAAFEVAGRIAVLRNDLLRHLSSGAKPGENDGHREILTVAGAAKELGLSESSVRDHCRVGRIPARRVGRRWFIPRPQLLAFLAEKEDDRPRRQGSRPSTPALRILRGEQRLPRREGER